MKKVIEIIKAENANDPKIKRYEIAIKTGLSTGIMDLEVPEIGQVITNGQQDMTVTGYVVGERDVCLTFAEFGSPVTAKQISDMLISGSIRIK